MGSPASDYIPLLEGAGAVRRAIGKTLGIKSWSVDQFRENAREARRVQQIYTNKMIDDLKERIENGDETPSILGNILRQKILTDEEVLLASYTGSMFSFHFPYQYVLHYLTDFYQQSLLELMLATRSPGLSLTSRTGPTCRRLATRLFRKCMVVSHPNHTSLIVSNSLRLCIWLASPS